MSFRYKSGDRVDMDTSTKINIIRNRSTKLEGYSHGHFEKIETSTILIRGRSITNINSPSWGEASIMLGLPYLNVRRGGKDEISAGSLPLEH